MLFRNVKIDAQCIRNAAEKWCEDYKPFVLYYLRNKKFVTVEQAYEDFEQESSYITKERVCPECGSTTESEDEESNPSIYTSDIARMFTDLGDSSIGPWIENADEAGVDWYDQEVDLAWVMRKRWSYKELWHIDCIWTNGTTEGLEDCDSRDACIAFIERRAARGYTYRYRITSPDGQTEEIDKTEPKPAPDPTGTTYTAMTEGHAVRCGHNYEKGVDADLRCDHLAQWTWADGNLNHPSFLCDEHLPLHGSAKEQAHVEEA